MEYLNSVWQIGILALIAGAVIGALAYRFLAPSVRQAVKDRAERDAAREELSSYKDSVNEHFQKTSELVNDLTQNYLKVYQHLAEGAHALGDSRAFDNLLQHHSGKVSLTVEGELQPANPVADDTIIRTDAPPGKPAETAGDIGGTIPDGNTSGVAPVAAEDTGTETFAVTSADEDDATWEAAFDVDAPGETTDGDYSANTDDAGDNINEGGKDAVTSRNVH